MAEELTAYCLKCRAFRPILDAQPEWAPNGTPATRGRCEVCATRLYRRGHTPAHDTLPKLPAPTAGTAATVSPKTKAKSAGKSRATAGNGHKPAATADDRSAGRHIRLVVVESPTKAKTIGKYLGRGYVVKSSIGHVRDLLKSRLSVDVDRDYAPEYRVMNEKRKIVKELQEAAAEAREIYLATDPDREGEAIAWHVMESAEMDPARVKRVVFQEITQPAIKAAFENPRQIDMARVNAQQARRILDRLVGYQLSPLLWRKVRGRLSAGRVQSVAVRLVVEREREITAFVPQEYWTLMVALSQHKYAGKASRSTFNARFYRFRGKDLVLTSDAEVRPHVAALTEAAWGVGSVKLGQRQRRPAAPFTTSTLQQEASRKLGFDTSKTMRLAQQLYEGVDVGAEGSIGLITYMRTDSVAVAQEAQAEARSYILHAYGDGFVPERPPFYRTRSKTAQEAHEAIRPTAVRRTPEVIKSHLSRDQQRLYQLIWSRFVASQMSPAVYDTVSAEIYAGPASQPVARRPYHFRATGSSLRFTGFLVLYEETAPSDRPDDSENQVPADLQADELLDLLKLLPEQHFTQPLPRYTEATLVKELEENGIGRPSTYASTISTILDRGYVVREDKRLVPTEVGEVVTDLLVEHFPTVLSADFTAQLEDRLDDIAGGQPWVPVVDTFYKDFAVQLAAAEAKIEKVNLPVEVEYAGRDCPLCNNPLVYREGPFGRFIGCSRFPTCRHTEQIKVTTGVFCAAGGGELVEKRTPRGRTFYGCDRYPTCQWRSWSRPVRSDAGGNWVQVNKQKVELVPCGLHAEPVGRAEKPARAARKPSRSKKAQT